MRRALALVALLVLGCGGEVDLIRDSSFDLWCGDRLCSWSVDQGSAVSIPTWHDSDRGVQLEGDPVVLSQTVPAAMLDACLHLYVTGDIPAGNRIVATFSTDGYERRLSLTPMHWEERRAELPSPVPRLGTSPPLRVELRKTGPGRVVIAQLRVTAGWCDAR